MSNFTHICVCKSSHAMLSSGYEISHESLACSWYTHEPLGEYVYQENASDKWDIL